MGQDGIHRFPRGTPHRWGCPPLGSPQAALVLLSFFLSLSRLVVFWIRHMSSLGPVFRTNVRLLKMVGLHAGLRGTFALDLAFPLGSVVGEGNLLAGLCDLIFHNVQGIAVQGYWSHQEVQVGLNAWESRGSLM